jgi:hypothetical protein
MLQPPPLPQQQQQQLLRRHTVQEQDTSAVRLAPVQLHTNSSSSSSSVVEAGSGVAVRPVVYGKQLTQLLQHAGSPSELAAVLQCSWPAVQGIHTVAATQQLVKLQQQQQQEKDVEHKVVQPLAQQLLQHAAELAAASLITVTGSGVDQKRSSPLQQQQQLDSRNVRCFSAREIAVLLRAAALLQPKGLHQPLQVLLQLLQQVVADLAAAQQVNGAALVNVFQGAAWLLQQGRADEQQQQQQKPQAQPPLIQLHVQQHKEQRQLQQQTQGLNNEKSMQWQPAAADTTKLQRNAQQQQVQQDSQTQLLLQQRLQLLRTQQQQQLQQLQGPTWRSPAAAVHDTSMHQQQQQQQQGQVLHESHQQQQQQQQRQQVQQLLAQLLSCCCQPGSVLQLQGLQLKQLAALLSLSADVGLMPSAAIMLQLLTTAGLSSRSSSSSSSSVSSRRDSSGSLQQLQLQPGDAAAVLWQLATSAELEQQQMAVASSGSSNSMAGVTCAFSSSSSSSSRVDNQVLQSILHTQCLQPLLLAVAPASANGAAAASVRDMCVALAATAKLATMLDSVQQQRQQQQQRGSSRLASSVETYRAYAGVTAASLHTVAGASAGEHADDINSSININLAAAGATAAVLQQLRDALLCVAEQQPPNQQQQQGKSRQQWRQLPGSQAVGALQSLQVLQQHLQQQQMPSTRQQALDNKEQQQQQQQQSSELLHLRWLCRFAAAIQSQLSSTHSSCVSPEQLTYVMNMLVTYDAWRLPMRWYAAVEAAVLFHLQGLQHPSGPRCRPAAAVKLLHAWVQLLLLLQRQQLKHQRYQAANALPAEKGTNTTKQRSTEDIIVISSSTRPAHVFKSSAGFRVGVCAALEPHLPQLDPEALGLAAWAVATLGPADRQQWLTHLLPAVAAAAAAAAAGSSSSSSSSKAGVLPAQALLHILQSLVLLRCRPPVVLLQQLLGIAARDMALWRGSALVQLLLLLVQLRVRPAAGWMRGLLLRAQGKLRMLNFEELTQVRVG